MANEKHIFIGIGGSGVKTVSQIKQKVYEKRFPRATASKTRLQAMNDSYRFIFLDTDQRDIDEANKSNRESFESGKVPFINPQTDLINLGRANPQAIYYEAKNEPAKVRTLINKRILAACSEELSNRIPDQPLSFGAGAFRIKSRIAFAHSLADFQSKLQSAISSLNDVKTVGGQDCIIYYWVVGSTVGGTGSGIFNDVLYHINQLHHQIVGNGDPQLVLTMYMPKVYIDSNSTEEKYALNAFAVFKELEAFKKMSYIDRQKTVMHRLAFIDDYNLVNDRRRYCPFYYLVPIDIQTDKGTSLGTPNTMYRNTAEMLYHLHNGQAGATFRSDIDNYMNDIMEADHSEFLVPMGYVSLQKPLEQFSKYMRARFQRDLLRSWLLCSTKSQAKVKKEDVKPLANNLFRELDHTIKGSIASSFLNNKDSIMASIEDQDSSSKKMNSDLQFENISSDIKAIEQRIKNESSEEKLTEYKAILSDNLWKEAEKLIRTNGLAYTINALQEVHSQLAEDVKKSENTNTSEKERLKETEEKLQKMSEDAAKIDTMEKVGIKDNRDQISAYLNELKDYIENFIAHYIKEWANEIKREFCKDEKNDEISKLIRHLQGVNIKAEELTRERVAYYKRLANDFGEASMDVTTVYLPMLKRICDGNGWRQDNFFSKLYTKVISAESDPEETPERKELMRFFDNGIYLTADEEAVDSNYKAALKHKGADADNSDEPKTRETLFFANPRLAERGNVSAEKVITDFINLATSLFEKAVHNNKEIQENWEHRKISSFFADLNNDEKDEVRRALSPALFFSYNISRIDVSKKEEHIIFVAGSEELAEEMLGYQRGNTKHRFEKNDNENTALVLRSKFGLSLEDYRIYDSLRRVYNRAPFREKYHFHHDFAQFLDNLTIDDLPVEILPQHRTFVKMLMLESLREQLAPFFYSDKYDADSFTNTMYYSDYDRSFKIALSEALNTDNNLAEGKLVLRKHDHNRPLFVEIEGVTFAERFNAYKDIYHNAGFGATAERLIQAILRTEILLNGVKETGEDVLKKHYTAKHEEMLEQLNNKKLNAGLPEEKRLYNIFFQILRNDYPTVRDFKR